MSVDCPTDGEWLTRFVRDRDADAFARLVRRHGPMVYRLCARICRTADDAEDAAQNVFMTLAAKAPTLIGRASIAGWLHHTARHTAMRWRRSADNRLAHELRAAELRPDRSEREGGPTGGALAADEFDDETFDKLHRALGALPEDYRSAMILHHLEGHTIEQVARIMATPPGTIAARLSRGRSMLRRRLAVIFGASGFPLAVEELLWGGGADPLPAEVVDAIRRPGSPPATVTGVGAVARTGGTAAVVATSAAPMTLAVQARAAVTLVALSAATVAAGGGVAAYSAAVMPEEPQTSRAEPKSTSKASWSFMYESTGAAVPEPSGLIWLAPIAGLTCRRRMRR
jgi:RNA polymerase sigma factor (sigma-70 family)